MKNRILSLIGAALMLVGCTNQNINRSNLSIVSPTGAPSLAFYQYASLANFETNSDPTNIIPMMVAGQKDVVVLPTNAGMQAILNRQAPYKIAATITFGNFYLISMGNDDNNQMDASDTILLFQKNNVPDKIFHYVYGNELDSAIHYVTAVSDAATAAISGRFVDGESGNSLVPNYVLLAEPALTNVMSKKEGLTVYANMQEQYKAKSNGLTIFQASVFLKNSVEQKDGDAFLNSLKNDINSAIKDPTLLSAGLNKATSPNEQFGIAPAMAEAVLKKNNGMGLGFARAKENKESIENFLKLFNITGVNEENYF